MRVNINAHENHTYCQSDRSVNGLIIIPATNLSFPSYTRCCSGYTQDSTEECTLLEFQARVVHMCHLPEYHARSRGRTGALRQIREVLRL